MVEENQDLTFVHKPLKSFLSSVGRNLYRAWDEIGWPISTILEGTEPLRAFVTSKIAKIKSGEKVLEIGSGYPFYRTYAQKVGADGVFVALDINETIQKRAKKIGYFFDKIMGKTSDQSTHLVTGDALQLPFSNEIFDVVVSSNFTGGKAFVNEAYRALKPGGRFICSFAEEKMPEFTNKIVAQCQELGFQNIDHKPRVYDLLTLMSHGAMKVWYVTAVKPPTNIPSQD